MCLLAFGWRPRPGLRLALVGNRDEFHARPTAALHAWPETPGLYAGRDLQAGGTWCGVGPGSRVAALTNFRSLTAPPPDAPSRGELVSGFLQGSASAKDQARTVQAKAHRYAGFSLVLADANEAWVVSNRMSAARALEPGLYGLSNALLDTPWPKLLRSRAALRQALETGITDPRELATLLFDTTPPTPDEAEDEQAMTTDEANEDAALLQHFQDRYGPALVNAMAAPFVLDDRYGTRATTTIVVPESGMGDILEWQYAADGTRSSEQHFRFEVA